MLARCATDVGIAVNWAGSGTTTPSVMQIELIDRLKPTIWMGMSSYGLHLANLAEARGLDLAASSVKTILCSAEPLSDAKRAKLARQWGAQVRDTFGMTEAGMMGAEDAGGGGFRIWTDMFLIEVLDPDTNAPVAEGEVGSLVVTPLWTNNVTPFLRWSSGDLVDLAAGRGGRRPVLGVPAGQARPPHHRLLQGARHQPEPRGVRGLHVPRHGDRGLQGGAAAARAISTCCCCRSSCGAARRPEPVAAALKTSVRDTFGLTPEVAVLETGTLAQGVRGERQDAALCRPPAIGENAQHAGAAWQESELVRSGCAA